MNRNARGILFVDYVRALRAFGVEAAAARLRPEDRVFLRSRIDLEGWYPMATFERMGLVILRQILEMDFAAVESWGYNQIAAIVAKLPTLLAEGDPRETLMRFRIFAGEFFDFPAIVVDEVDDQAAAATVAYGMSPDAEHAAAMQCMGFFVGLLEQAGATAVDARYTERCWEGTSRTSRLVLSWTPPGAAPPTGG